jgi:hypothetical protein
MAAREGEMAYAPNLSMFWCISTLTVEWSAMIFFTAREGDAHKIVGKGVEKEILSVQNP